jgi:hypothetical protein
MEQNLFSSLLLNGPNKFGPDMPIQTGIRSASKAGANPHFSGLPEANALAYLTSSSVMKKSFMT